MNEHLSLNKSVGIFMVVFKAQGLLFFFLSKRLHAIYTLKNTGRCINYVARGLYCFQNDSQPQRDKDIIGITFGKRFTRCA